MRSSSGAMVDTFTQRSEVRSIRRCCRFGICALEQQPAQIQPILIFADQLTHLFAAAPEAAAGNLLVDKGLERIGQGNVHRAQDARRIGNTWREPSVEPFCPCTR